MITVSLLEPNWKELFESELAKIGLKRCNNKKTDNYVMFKYGIRKIRFKSDYSFVDIKKYRESLMKTENEVCFDEVGFFSYIQQLTDAKRKRQQNINAIKFAQEFFEIRLTGLLQDIHHSIKKLKFVYETKSIYVEFELYNMPFQLNFSSAKTIQNIVEVDFMDCTWKLIAYRYRKYGSYNKEFLFSQKYKLENILQLLSQESIKELAEENLQKINSFNDKIKENERTIQWYKSENEKYTLDSSKLDLEIAMKMKELYETFRHRPSENSISKSLTTGEEGIPKT